MPERIFSNSLQARNRQPAAASSNTALHVGFVLLRHFSLPAFTQSLDTLVTANLIRPDAFVYTTYSLDESDVVSDLGIPIRAGQALDALAPESLDLLIVCGGLRTPCNTTKRLSGVLKAAAESGTWLGGLWNGAWFLAEAGLLNGYRCAIHPEQRLGLAEMGRGIQVMNVTHMVDRDRLTAASPNGAFYMLLEWMGTQYDSELVNGVVDILAFDMSRVRAASQSRYRNVATPIQEVVALMEANLEDPLPINELARYAGRSRRQIERLFNDQLGTTPQRHYLELRVTEARRLLQHSSLSIMEVGVACGFVSPSHFSKCYAAYFGHRPSKEIRLDRRMSEHA
mgnify:CR=1 FL=1